MSTTPEIKETAVAVKQHHKVAQNYEEYKVQADLMLKRFLEELKNTDNTWEAFYTTPQIQAWKKIVRVLFLLEDVKDDVLNIVRTRRAEYTKSNSSL